MACSVGFFHTITLSNDGEVHSFGDNKFGQLGLGERAEESVAIPTPILNFPKIKQISCGEYFTVCLDIEGFIWSFGKNESGQLGVGNELRSDIPQQIPDIPLVYSISSGGSHTLVITVDGDIWSFGHNGNGQLCLGHFDNQKKPQKTSLSDITKIVSGFRYSLLQKNSGEIYGVGSNGYGQLGMGATTVQTQPRLIPNQPSDIHQFSCGYFHSLFLDNDGNVYSTGYNAYGSLGLSNNISHFSLNQILNIPPIMHITAIGYSSYLLDFEGEIWSFGNSIYGQLGHNNYKH